MAGDVAISTLSEALTGLTWHGMWTIQDGLHTLMGHTQYQTAWYSMVIISEHLEDILFTHHHIQLIYSRSQEFVVK